MTFENTLFDVTKKMEKENSMRKLVKYVHLNENY